MCLEGNVNLMAAVNGNKEDKVAKKTNGWQQKVFCKAGEWQHTMAPDTNAAKHS